jgi:hypothetical protein
MKKGDKKQENKKGKREETKQKKNIRKEKR